MCPCDTENCPTISLLEGGWITDNGGFEFTIVGASTCTRNKTMNTSEPFIEVAILAQMLEDSKFGAVGLGEASCASHPNLSKFEEHLNEAQSRRLLACVSLMNILEDEIDKILSTTGNIP